MSDITMLNGESADSCRFRSTIKKSVETDFFVPATKASVKAFPQRTPEFYHKRTMRVLSLGAAIYLDACFLMNKCAPKFFAEFEQDLKQAGITLHLFTQVRQELETLSRFGNEKQQMKATRALDILKKYHRLFRYAPSDVDLYNGDKALCRELLRNHATRNQILLTNDGDLANSILNLCGGIKSPDSNVETMVLRLNQYGYLSLFNIGDMNLAPEINLPSDYLRANPNASCGNQRVASAYVPYQYAPATALLTAAAFKGKDPDKYYNDAISNGSCYMSGDALRDAFDASGNNAFLVRLHQMYLNGIPVKIYVLSLSLTEELRSKMAMWIHLFEIIELSGTFCSEVDALLAAMSTEPYVGECLHQLLICHNPQTYEEIYRRLPICHNVKSIWGTVITREGYLLSTRLVRGYHNESHAYIADSSLSA